MFVKAESDTKGRENERERVGTGGKAVSVGFGGSGSGFQPTGDATGPPGHGRRPVPGPVCDFETRLCRYLCRWRARGAAAISW